MATLQFYHSTFNTDSSETIAYNHPLFPVYIRVGQLSMYPDYSAISHWHDDFEFILILHGNMTYNVNGQIVALTPGNGIFVNSKQLHFGFSAMKEECKFICILISPALLQGNSWFFDNCIAPITENSMLPFLYLDKSGWGKNILNKLEIMYQDYDPNNITSCFEMVESLLYICKIIYQKMPSAPNASKMESSVLSCVKDMVLYIDKHYMEPIHLTDVATSGRCCKSKCSILFKEYLHDTPVSYITKVRLRKSLTALLETDDPITKIAYNYGFGCSSYYCETFRKYYQESPSQYRRQFHSLNVQK